MGRILTLLGLKKRAFAAINGRQEVSVSDDEAAGVEASLAKADAACLTAGDVLGCSIAGAAVSLAADGYADGRLVPAASVSVAKEAPAVTYTVTPYFGGSKCSMDEIDGGYKVSFQMAFKLGVLGEEGTAAAELSGVHYYIKSLKLYKTNSTGAGTTYVDFMAGLVLGFSASHYNASSVSMWLAAGNTVATSNVTVSMTSGLVCTLAYTVTDASSVSLLDEFLTYVRNGYYRLVLVGATSDSRFDNSDITVTT